MLILRVEKMACFKQVARVIGEKAAKVELFIAVNGYKNEGFPLNVTEGLRSAFLWIDTPQKHDFWDMIDDGINPLQGNKLLNIKAEDLACFGQVAQVIGIDRAKQELDIVLEELRYADLDDCDIEDLLEQPCVGGAFDWQDTPQKSDFWYKVYNRKNPYIWWRGKQ